MNAFVRFFDILTLLFHQTEAKFTMVDFEPFETPFTNVQQNNSDLKGYKKTQKFPNPKDTSTHSPQHIPIICLMPIQKLGQTRQKIKSIREGHEP